MKPRAAAVRSNVSFPHPAAPTLATAASTTAFLAIERLWPGRELPRARGWYARALALNLAQMALTLATRGVWVVLLGGRSVLHLARAGAPVVEGLVAWLVSTLPYYWWHRLRHVRGFWRVFHQVHHSPARIEVLTSFYKHPLEIVSDIVLSGVVAYAILGISLQGAFWFNFFAATGEYLYHANFRSPRWLRYFIQTPELHSVHHQRDVHRYNFSDLPLWDRLFGTYKDVDQFAPACGFPRDNERKLLPMLTFKDVYDD
jgi:sterol desaturase/sphingolipid hydroxylase (fatty acid hydroxylase superfamily)